ncbi:MAG: CapA family protein [Chloroflexia bacterium]|nr:CapA family protein [Chloroflexia bacterium]
MRSRQPKKQTSALLLLLGILLCACGPALTSPAASSPPAVATTSLPSTQVPPATAVPLATPAPPTATPIPTERPTPTPPLPPPPALGLSRLWAWTADDIINDFLPRDLDGDGLPEIVVASYDRRVYVVDAWGQTWWSWDTGASVFSLELADLDGDGRDEILAGTEAGELLALDAGGGLLWQVPLAGRVTAIAAVDLEGDDRPEILAGARPAGAWALRGDGSVLWQQQTTGAPTAFASFASGHNQLIVLSTEAGAVQALDAAGVPSWRWEDAGYIRGMAALEGGVLAGGRDGLLRRFGFGGDLAAEIDLDSPIPIVLPVELYGDAQPEILVGTRKRLIALESNPSEERAHRHWDVFVEGGVWSLALADLEGDGQPEIAAGTDTGQILIVESHGMPRGYTWVPFRVHGLWAADLDGDGQDELLARASNHLYAFVGNSRGEVGEPQPLVRTLERWPEETVLLQPAEDEIVLAAVGDIMIGRAVEPRMLMYGALFPFEALLPLLQGADLTTGNLEGVLAFYGEPLQKSYTFRGHPGLATGLQQAGFDLLNLANNHARDFGQEGLDETIATLEEAGIAAVGAGPAAYEPVFIEVKGIRLAFLGRTAAIGPQEGVAWTEAEELRQAVIAAQQQADLVIVHLHAGYEYWTTYEATQQQLAQAAAAGGAALVIGHHPHALQEVEWIRETLVAYSLGDFVFDIDDHNVARDAVVLRVLLSRQGVQGVEWIRARIINDVQPRPMVDEEGGPWVEVLFGEP